MLLTDQAPTFASAIDPEFRHDIMHGLSKAGLFSALITLVGVINGAGVSGGAEGVGRMTTRSVVLSISAIIVTDMLFAFVTTR